MAQRIRIYLPPDPPPKGSPDHLPPEHRLVSIESSTLVPHANGVRVQVTMTDGSLHTHTQPMTKEDMLFLADNARRAAEKTKE